MQFILFSYFLFFFFLLNRLPIFFVLFIIRIRLKLSSDNSFQWFNSRSMDLFIPNRQLRHESEYVMLWRCGREREPNEIECGNESGQRNYNLLCPTVSAEFYWKIPGRKIGDMRNYLDSSLARNRMNANSATINLNNNLRYFIYEMWKSILINVQLTHSQYCAKTIPTVYLSQSSTLC